MASPPVQVRIRGYQFSVSAPYTKGQKLGEVEVQQLNDLRADNIRNNMTKPVLDAIAALSSGAMLSPAQVAGLQASISDYDSRYHLQLKHQARPRVGLIEAEAKLLAEERLDTQLRTSGTTVTLEEYERFTREFMALPEIQELARARVQARAQVMQHSLEDL